MRKLHAVLLAVGVGCFAYVLAKMGLRELWRELGLLGWWLIPLILGEGVAEMIHVLGWRHCLSEPHRSLPWRTLFGIRMAGYAINYLTPTAALGGELSKGVLLAADNHRAEAASGVLIGKVCFSLAHVLFVALGAALVLWRVRLPPGLWLGMLGSGVLVAAGMLVLLWLQVRGKLGAAARWLAARKLGGRQLENVARRMSAVDEALKRFYRERPRDLALAIGWHLVGYSIGIAQTGLFLHLVAPGHAALVIAATAWFLGMWFDLLTFVVPLNLGTLEATRIVAFRALGLTALAGLTYGIATRLAQMFWAGFGLITYAALSARIRSAERLIGPGVSEDRHENALSGRSQLANGANGDPPNGRNRSPARDLCARERVS